MDSLGPGRRQRGGGGGLRRRLRRDDPQRVHDELLLHLGVHGADDALADPDRDLREKTTEMESGVQ